MAVIPLMLVCWMNPGGNEKTSRDALTRSTPAWQSAIQGRQDKATQRIKGGWLIKVHSEGNLQGQGPRAVDPRRLAVIGNFRLRD